MGAKTTLSSVRWMWLSSTPGGSWSVTLTSLTVPNSRRGQHSPCGGGRSSSFWATFLSMVTVRVVELFVLLALACQSSCVLTRISRFRLWASFLRIRLRSFPFKTLIQMIFGDFFFFVFFFDAKRVLAPTARGPGVKLNYLRCISIRFLTWTNINKA